MPSFTIPIALAPMGSRFVVDAAFGGVMMVEGIHHIGHRQAGKSVSRTGNVARTSVADRGVT